MDKLIMIGNPGVGKSTLLTSLVDGTTQFYSGVSVRMGLTPNLQEVEYHGTTYIKTPGLSDVKLREQAAVEIMKAFKRGGNFRVFFVITLESGRVKPDDLTTVKLVLDAVPQIKDNQYSIIINKITPEVQEMLRQYPEERKELAETLHPPSFVGRQTRLIFYNPLNPLWEDQSNVWGKLNHDLLDFIAVAPTITVTPENRNIQDMVYEKQFMKLREELRKLRSDIRKQ